MERQGVGEQELQDRLQLHALALPDVTALGPLFDRIGQARIVMLGESTHGTHEFYTWRAYITQKLIEEKGFQCVALEADWPDCYRLNRFVKGVDKDHDNALQVVQSFRRWPTWMWANWEMVAFANWMRAYNEHRSYKRRVGIYGLDVYSLWESIENIVHYLREKDPDSMPMAMDALQCFEPFRQESEILYGRSNRFVPESCAAEVAQLLKRIRTQLPGYNSDPEQQLNVQQNAEIAVNAEQYYRVMVEGGAHSWNLRDRHMYETMNRLLDFHGEDSRIVVWAHNTHIGDARATSMVDEGMFNLGEIARIKNYDDGVVLVGFGSYKGHVIASREWGSEMHRMILPAAKPGSLEYIFHANLPANQLLITQKLLTSKEWMDQHVGHRAIGVVYHPETDAYHQYVPTVLPLRYDAFVHLDETGAVFPLHQEAAANRTPDTFPFGL